ncbi:hypothetical protein K2D_01770 [Planctomycetes bacterium K2D]|uniref:Uncharacterized protein n=1 Tax=Botrimarina mediterranea TaxID=2528022 RepID=A0A518K2P2_9BACT|nr:hypothetical protein Spa11_02270 [Botrimarina mediterranea]QDV76598.1 hypothetical protein K2D_01770 [Planctomycetes bacterium K2D]
MTLKYGDQAKGRLALRRESILGLTAKNYLLIASCTVE